jgi:hypothetical protein
MFARSVPMFTVKGAPDSRITMPFTCHPEARAAATPVPEPLKSGSAYVTLPTKRCR